MKRTIRTARMGLSKTATMVMILVSAASVAVAQPPERPEGPPSPGGSFEGPAGGREGRGPGGSREGRSGPGLREGRGGPGGGGPGGPPSPERFVERAMKFDADGDGKLDRVELTKFAEELQRMRGGGPGGRGPGGPDGVRGPDGPRGPSEGGGRPERPTRSE